MTERIIISSESQGERLDKFLCGRLPDLSRTKIQKLIKDGLILINEKTTTVHYFLKNKDRLEISLEEAPNAAKAKTKEINRKKESKKSKKLLDRIKIIKDTDDFLILEKPAGLLVHATAVSTAQTLVDWLLDKYPRLKKIGEDPQRPAIVHRLDKDVSGLMLIPKNQAAFDYFKNQFKQHLIVKKYLCLVTGRIAKDEDEINFPISRSRTKQGLFAAHPHNHEGKKAITRFAVVKRYLNHTLLEVQILTGRTHQIRVHLLGYGHPVVGDKLYLTGMKQKNNPGRIFLHAAELAFTDPDGEKRTFTSKLPRKLSLFLDKIK